MDMQEEKYDCNSAIHNLNKQMSLLPVFLFFVFKILKKKEQSLTNMNMHIQ